MLSEDADTDKDN